MSTKIGTYADVEALLKEKGRSHLLVGNGFSIACDPVFNYGSLYKKAVANGLSDRAQSVFQYIGTNNFEAVMRLLFDGQWLNETYGLSRSGQSPFLADVEIVRNTLVSTIATSHPEHAGSIDVSKKQLAAKFLEPYHNVFSLNYDLLLYWVNMACEPGPRYEDGFRPHCDSPDDPALVFSDHLGGKKGIFYIHGALHLFTDGGYIKKHAWCRTQERLTSLIKTGLSEKRYPLFVAEGDANRKLEQIRNNGYLSYCYDKLGRIENRLVTVGFSFGESDKHICAAIAENTNIKQLVVGVFGDADSEVNQALFRSLSQIQKKRAAMLVDLTKRKRTEHQLEVFLFRSESAEIWNRNDEGPAKRLRTALMLPAVDASTSLWA